MGTLKLLENPYNPIEKRKIPNFPFCFLTFKNLGKSFHQVFEVREISMTGAQFLLKDGKLNFAPDQEIEGEFHWKGNTLKIRGKVIWVRDKRFGLKFKNLFGLPNFLSVENVLAGMQAVHKNILSIQYPTNLKYWLHSDGPVEIFVWEHPDGEFKEFQIIYFKNYLEWVDGFGLKTGIVLTRRNSETSIFDEEEFLFQMDKTLDNSKINEILPLLDKIPNDFLPSSVINFFKLKLGI